MSIRNQFAPMQVNAPMCRLVGYNTTRGITLLARYCTISQLSDGGRRSTLKRSLYGLRAASLGEPIPKADSGQSGA